MSDGVEAARRLLVHTVVQAWADDTFRGEVLEKHVGALIEAVRAEERRRVSDLLRDLAEASREAQKAAIHGGRARHEIDTIIAGITQEAQA